MPLQGSCPPQHSLSPHSQRHAHGPQFPNKSNAQNEDLTPPLRPAEMVSIRIQDLERPASPEENQSCIGMMNQNSLTGLQPMARPLELVTLRQDWAFPYSGKRLQWLHQYYCTRLLRIEKTMGHQWSHWTELPIPQRRGFLPAPAFIPLV